MPPHRGAAAAAAAAEAVKAAAAEHAPPPSKRWRLDDDDDDADAAPPSRKPAPPAADPQVTPRALFVAGSAPPRSAAPRPLGDITNILASPPSSVTTPAAAATGAPDVPAEFAATDELRTSYLMGYEEARGGKVFKDFFDADMFDKKACVAGFLEGRRVAGAAKPAAPTPHTAFCSPAARAVRPTTHDPGANI